MSSFTVAGQTFKDELALEYTNAHSEEEFKALINTKPNPQKVFDNIEIVFKSASKNMALAGKEVEADEDLSGLVSEYMLKGNRDSYEDALKSAALIKRISYLLFTNQVDNFDIAQRTKYSEALRKQESALPQLSVKIYTTKKELLELLEEGFVDYTKIQGMMRTILQSLGGMLKAQQEVYNCELVLGAKFGNYLEKSIIPEWFQPGYKADRSAVNSILQAYKSMEKRGINVPKVPGKLTQEICEEILQAIRSHLGSVRSLSEEMGKILSFISDVMKYMDRPGGAPPEVVQETSKPKEPQGISDMLFGWLKR